MATLFTTSGLPAAIRSTGWFIYQDYDGLWYARNPITEGRCMDGRESIDEVVDELVKSFTTMGLWMGQIGRVKIDGEDKCQKK